MTETLPADNIKKSLTFLKALYEGRHVNIVAIDPHSQNITAITRPEGSADIENFITKNYNKRNLYFMVNTPKGDAPDNKLKKEHVAEINAVWIDADPLPFPASPSGVEPSSADKEKHFQNERKRLLGFAKDLASSTNPPTVITDSGGGIQAFWFLEHPVPVTEESRKQYEALSRGLADQYDTDRVHNIDRIMRLPYTWNIPTAKKKGRVKTLAKSKRIGNRYVNDTLPVFITPVDADDVENEIDYTQLDMVEARKPPSAALLAKFEQTRAINQKVDDLWTGVVAWKPSRSEVDFTLAKELKAEGYTLFETAQIMLMCSHGKGKDLTRREIVRCYERSGNDLRGTLDAEHVERIEKQINPLKKAKEIIQKMIDNADYILGGSATVAGSGVPLFKHFLNAETVNVLFGPSGSGKSFLTLDMAMHLAAGRAWAGFRCKQKMAVLYVCTESGASFGKRAFAARAKLKIREGATAREFPFAYYPAHVDLLNNKDHMKIIMKLIDQLEKESGYKVGMVVVDTLSAAFGGGNENSEDMTKFVNNMAEIKYLKKTAVLVVHHTGKDESAGARGHSSLKGNVDTEIQVRSEKRGEKYYRSFTSTKQKDDETGSVTRFGLRVVKLGEDEDGDAITTCSVMLEGDPDFDMMVPSIEEGLEAGPLAALQAIRYYDAAMRQPDKKVTYSHTDLQAKCVIFHDILTANGLFSDGSLKPLSVMSIPTKAQLKAFSRSCDVLQTKNLVRNGSKYHLDYEHEKHN